VALLEYSLKELLEVVVVLAVELVATPTGLVVKEAEAWLAGAVHQQEVATAFRAKEAVG
jgi:hypothetical protein